MITNSRIIFKLKKNLHLLASQPQIFHLILCNEKGLTDTAKDSSSFYYKKFSNELQLRFIIFLF